MVNPIIIIGIIVAVIIAGVALFIGSITPVSQVTTRDEPPVIELVDLVECSGTARCITGRVTNITDGDTLDIDGKPVRFALASAPESFEPDGPTATQLIEQLCPVGSVATVDEDDGQTGGSYGRILGVVYCNGYNLSSELLDSGVGYLLEEFCETSEFANTDWIQKHGCRQEYAPITTPPVTIENKPEDSGTETESNPNCSEYYPDVCIAPYPPDLDCGEISFKNFKVVQPDPHGFDGDKDGIGCEN